MRRIFLVVAGLVMSAGFALPVSAQEPAAPRFSGYELTIFGNTEGVSVEQDDGRETLIVERATAMLGDVDFAEGVIEFDIALGTAFGFGGVIWHASETNDGEYFYLRQHKSGLPDAGQYTPIRQGLTSWQIHSDANGIAPFAFTHEGWNRFKMIVAGDKADIYFNGSTKPVLHIPDLATDRGRGGVGFRATGPNGRIRIANLAIRPLEASEAIVGEAAEVAGPPPGVIGRWTVSERFAEEAVADRLTLPVEISGLNALGTLPAGPTGIVDISRLARPQDANDTVLVSTRIMADSAKPVRLAFGYSDRVRLFLNGELVFDGVAGWRSRDFFFLGTIGFNDAVVLPLREGENVLSAAVSETFGGWGFAGAITDREGLTVVAE